MIYSWSHKYDDVKLQLYELCEYVIAFLYSEYQFIIIHFFLYLCCVNVCVCVCPGLRIRYLNRVRTERIVYFQSRWHCIKLELSNHRRKEKKLAELGWTKTHYYIFSVMRACNKYVRKCSFLAEKYSKDDITLQFVWTTVKLTLTSVDTVFTTK